MGIGAGRGLMGWQSRDVLDVALEVLPDGSWAYQVVIVHVQRQAGKTTLFGPVANHRCATVPDAKCWLTAQTGYDARDVFLDIAKMVERSPFARAVRIRRANGTESMTWPNGATFRPFPPVEDAMHGKANALVAVDEGWAFTDEVGTALEAAIVPTFTTTGGQLWILSAGGTAKSAWLLRHVLNGRASVLAGVNTGIAYFEYGIDTTADPDGQSDASRVAARLEAWKADPGDQRSLDEAIAIVSAAHPAAGDPADGFTLRRDALVNAARSMKVGEFMRAYGNVWTPSGERVIPEALWDAAGRDVTRESSWPRPSGPVALGVAAAPDHRDAAIVAAWRDGPGQPIRLDPIDVRPGIGWLAPRWAELITELRPAASGHDRAGPVVDVADEVTRSGHTLTSTSTADYAAACSAFLRAVVTAQLAHPRNPDLDTAVAAAARRQIGDGLWAWSRKASSASIATLEAATQAMWAYDHRAAPAPAPVVVARPRSGPAAPRRAPRRPRGT